MKSATRRSGMLAIAILALAGPGIAGGQAVEDVPAANDVTIDAVGALPRFFDDDVRLEWLVPGNSAATEILRDLEYAVVEVEVGDSLRRTFIARQVIDGRRLVHHYFFARAGAASDLGVRMDLDVPDGAALVLRTMPGFIPEPLPGFGAAYGAVRAVAIGADGQRGLTTDDDAVADIAAVVPAGDWFGVRNRFWTVLLRSGSAALDVDVALAAENLPVLAAQSPENSERLTLELLAGPVELRALRAVDPVLAEMLFAALWDWLRALCFGLLWILTVLQGLVGDMGVAIIFMSLCVKVLMSPLTLIADRLQDSVNKIQSLMQPDIDSIKKTYKGEEAHNRILAVYKQHGVHPLYFMKSLAGFLIQIPVFIAAFDMLGENIALSGATFLWIEDLAKPDRWLQLPLRLPFFGGYLNLLPCIMTAVTVLTSWIQTDPSLTPELLHKQRLRLYLMAGAFFLLFYTFPAGMVLYWTTNNVLHLVKIQLAGLIGRMRKA